MNPIEGTHALFAVRVPFIPSFLSGDFTRAATGEMGRIRLVVGRQIRFINDLATIKNIGSDSSATIDLRFLVQPKQDQPYCDVRVVFVGKVFCPDSTNSNEAKNLAICLWRQFYSHFPLEDPFNYPLLPVTEAELGQNGQEFVDPRVQFEQQYLWPIACERIKLSNLVEIRKYVDRDPQIEDPESTVGSYPHPFRPALDFSAMGRFLETLARQTQRCVVSISLRPTSLFDGELKGVILRLNQYLRLLEQQQQKEQETRKKRWLARYRQERFETIYRVYEPFIKQHQHLFSIKIQIIDEHEAPMDLVEALGSELMDNTRQEVYLWERVSPRTDKELDVAKTNFAFLEHRRWGGANSESAFQRLPFLVTAYEAAGAFRLPIPPESGYLPGLVVRDEPFVLPPKVVDSQTETRIEGPSVSLGRIIHRGTETDVEFNLSIDDLKRHALVVGSTGSGKTTTYLHLLVQLQAQHKIPFLVIYPIDKPDYRVLMWDKRVNERLLIFTLGDETTSKFRFNPFAVPPGILLKTHISRLMRCFMAAFSMWDPLPAVYRAALRKVYSDRGWNVEKDKGRRDPGAFPIMRDFYEAILELSLKLTEEYGEEVRGNIRQGSEIRIRDLIENTGSILNVQGDGTRWEDILDRPTVMELGRVGSTEDTALIMGFLLTCLSAELVSRQKCRRRELSSEKRLQDAPFQHFTLIEEAHQLMPATVGPSSEFLADPRSKGGEDFSNILAEVRGYGEGILISEQIPTNLVTGAIGNTYLKVMHWLEDKNSFDLFCDILNLNRQQREYARTLRPGQAIVRSPAGRPVLVQVTSYRRQSESKVDPLLRDTCDEDVCLFMKGRIDLPDAEDLELKKRPWGDACKFCLVPECSYYDEICALDQVLDRPENLKVFEPLFQAMSEDKPVDWEVLTAICDHFIESSPDRKAKAYCFLARWIFEADLDENPHLWQVLEQFGECYNDR